ncbi:glycosyltransferase [Reyranella sp.]|uniref:glycosyltransferase n=1 Tax=Reyranella sp. TaxID=1929291 RepID=UPI0037838D3C
MTVIERHQPARHRAIFLSDIHLGTRGCQAELLLDFLKRNESEYLYLVGDIVDGWRLKRWWYWPQAHNDVVQKIMRKARKGTTVIYVPGNHDEAARQYCQLTFGEVRVEEEAIHVTPGGRKLLVIHGDQFDGIVRYARWLAILGDWAYTMALRLNTLFNWGRQRLGLSYWLLPEYVHARIRPPVSWSYAFVRRFHAPSAAVLVVAQSIRDELAERGFKKLVPWSRGVDIAAFRPCPHRNIEETRPIWLYAGRVAIEKNIQAFLDLDLPGTKWVVGGGPQLGKLRRRYAKARFFGSVDTEKLSARYAEADCFVFPSRTDTFGLVMVEALASGVPVAGYPVPGPLDVITDPKVGALDDDLRSACLAAVGRDPSDCRRHAETFTWASCAQQFLATLQPIPRGTWQPLKRRVLPDAAAS